MNALLIIPPVAVAGAFATRRLTTVPGFGPIRASSGATLAFAALTLALPDELAPGLRATFFGATFVGMSTPARFGAKQLFGAALIYSGIYIAILSAPETVRFPGGVLGSSAFIAGVIVAALEQIFVRKPGR